jgi:hypothetical protein
MHIFIIYLQHLSCFAWPSKHQTRCSFGTGNPCWFGDLPREVPDQDTLSSLKIRGRNQRDFRPKISRWIQPIFVVVFHKNPIFFLLLETHQKI